MAKTRVEKDSIGTLNVPANALYGVQSLRGKNNFNITGIKIHPEFIVALAKVKKATTIANAAAGQIPNKIVKPMVQACDEIIAGKFHDQFIVETIQGGAGTSMNMNINEVVANRAAQIMNKPLGTYDVVHPNDHVNCGQSTNDVVPTAGKIAVLTMGANLVVELKELHKAMVAKQREFKNVIKMGRTHLQDAVPITLGQEFGAFAAALKRDIERVELTLKTMLEVNMGATAVGTGLNADKTYMKEVIKELKNVTKFNIKQTADLVDGTRNLDNFAWVSASLKTMAINLSKTANDLRLMVSGPTAGLMEIKLPEMQPGSSIMPGKVNPVIPEAINQIAFQVMGNDLVITKAAEAGQLELNVFEPVLFKNLFESLEIMTNGARMFRELAITGITANVENCANYVKNSVGIVTALVPHIGYANCAASAKEALKTKTPLADLIVSKKLMSKQDLNKVLNVKAMTTPGIAGEELLKGKKK